MEAALEEPPSFHLLLALIGQPAIFYIITGLTLVLLLILSALISGSEVAFFSLSQQQLAKCRDSGKLSDKSILHLIVRPKLLLATILILNNFVNIAIVTIATYATWEIVGASSTEGRLIVILSFAITFAIVFFGEVIPKVYANQNNLTFARIMARPLKVTGILLKPLSYLLMSATRIIERKLEKRGYNLSVDELNQALEITTDETTTEEEKEILKGIVNFGTIQVTQIMKSRLDITAVDVNMNFHDLMDKINKSGFSRIPVYKETLDNIEGILYIKDLLPYIDTEETFKWQKLIRPGFFVPDTKKIDTLFKDFQDKRVHMAIVVDEYGGTSGLVTLEDVIEEIVGEINDEFDEDEVAYNKLDDNTYIFEGKTTLNDFCKVIEEDVSLFDEVKGESESLGGLVLELSSKFPRVGEKVFFDKFVFTVVSADLKRIKRVRVFINEASKEKQKSSAR